MAKLPTDVDVPTAPPGTSAEVLESQVEHEGHHETLHKRVNTFTSPNEYSTLAAQAIDNADSLTGWVANKLGGGTGLQLDTTNKTEGSASVTAQVRGGSGNNLLEANLYVNLTGDESIGDYSHIAVDVRWKSTLNLEAWSHYQLQAASAIDFGGTVVSRAFPNIPQETWFTVFIPLSGLSAVRSIGIQSIDFNPDTSPGFNDLWIDNVRFKQMTELDRALGSLDTVAVIVPADYTPGLTQLRTELGDSKTLLDLRPGKIVLSGNNGVKSLREWGIDETGTSDVSADLQSIIEDLDEGDTLVAPPTAKFLNSATIRVHNKSNLVLDFQGAAFVTNTRRTDRVLDLEDCKNITIRNLRMFGYRQDVRDGSTLVTVAGTPTVSGTTMLLDAQDEEVRIPQVSSATPWYARDVDGLNKFEFTLSDSAQVASDCTISIKNDAGTVLASSTVTLTGTPTVYSLTLRPEDLGDRLYATVKKATATVNTITVTDSREYGRVVYSATYEQNTGIILTDSQHVLIEDCHVEGVGGAAISSSRRFNNDVITRRVLSRGCNQQGLTYNWGRNYLIEDCVVRETGRSGIDIEPFGSNWFVHDAIVRNCELINIENAGLACVNWARITNMTLENISCWRAENGLISGGSRGGVFRNLHSVDMSSAPAGTKDFNIAGINLDISGLYGVNGIAVEGSTNTWDDGDGLDTYTSAGNVVDGIRIADAKNAAIKCSGANVIRNVHLDKPDSPLSFTTNAGVANFGTSDYQGFNPGQWKTDLGNTYKGTAYKDIWFPNGLDLKDEPLYKSRGLSSTSVKANNLAQVDATVAASATTKAVAFPTKPYGAIVQDTIRTATTGGTLTSSTTYYYRTVARPVLGGPTFVGPEYSVTLGASDNAVNLGIKGWVDQTNDYHIAGVTIYRGTVLGGPYDTRYDIIPTQDFYAMRQDVATWKDEGSALTHTLGASEWGYASSYAAQSGSFTPADETGYEPDTNYAVVGIETNWDAGYVWVTSKARSGFTLNFATAAPGDGSGRVSWMIVR